MSKARILIVEDERIVAGDLQSRLESLGYEVAGIASTGEEAVQTALKARPDLVLMDIMLKGESDGIHAAEEINKKLDVPVVYLTAYADEATLQRAKITGPFGYIVKPFEQKGLHTTIETALYKHKLDKKLKESEERYRTLQENLPLGVFRVTPDGRTISVNPAMIKMLGYESEKELLETPVIDIYAVPKHRIEFRKRLKSERVVTDYEVRLVRKNGDYFWASLNVRAIRDDAGSVLYHDGTLRDISGQKRAEGLKREYFRNLTFLSKTAMDFVAQGTGEDVFNYMARNLKEIIPHSRIITITSRVGDSSPLTIRSLLGLGKAFHTVFELLGRDPVGLTIQVSDEINEQLAKGRLRRISTELDRHTGGLISKKTSRALTRALRLGPIYMMGILERDKLLGTAVIVMQKGYTLSNRDLAEAFIKQAAVALSRKQAEKALYSSEHRYRELFHNMPSGVLVLEAANDGKDFVIKEFNRAGEAISKMDKEQIIGKPMTKAFPGAKGSGLIDAIRNVWKTGNPEYLPAWLYKDTHLTGWRESYIYKLPSGEIIDMYQDVTEKIQARQALSNSEERYRSVVESARDAIISTNGEGLISFWNQAAERMFGYSGNEILGRPLTNIIPDRLRNGFTLGLKEIRKRVASRLVGNQIEMTALHRDGREFSIELSIVEWRLDKERFFTSFIRDITERKYMQEVILRAKQEWERTFDTVPDMIAVLNPECRIIRVNLSLADRLKCKPKELIGKHFYEVIYGTVNPPEKDRLPAIWEDGEELHREMHLDQLDGDISITLTPLYDYSERLIGSVFVGRDVTRQKHAEEALKRQAIIDQAEHIFSAIRHEMGNALNTLKTTLTVLMKNYQNFTVEKRGTYFTRCLDTFKVAERLLRVLKEYQKFDKLEMTPMYVDRFLQEKAGLFIDLAKNSNVTCEVELSFSDLMIKVDKDALIQILLNVVDNAIAATRDVKAPLITVKCRPWKEWAIITVTDNGKGIEEDDLAKVFTPLFTTKPEGSGLGMAIVQKRMTQMGGEAEIESKPNQGANVKLYFPLYSKEKVAQLQID